MHTYSSRLLIISELLSSELDASIYKTLLVSAYLACKFNRIITDTTIAIIIIMSIMLPYQWSPQADHKPLMINSLVHAKSHHNKSSPFYFSMRFRICVFQIIASSRYSRSAALTLASASTSFLLLSPSQQLIL